MCCVRSFGLNKFALVNIKAVTTLIPVQLVSIENDRIDPFTMHFGPYSGSQAFVEPVLS